MPKIYTKYTWVNEELVEDAEYSIDGGEPVTIELTTDVAVAGTGVTAERMNNIEDGIDGLDDKIIDVEDRLDGFEDSALDTETPELTDKVRGLDDPGGTPISVTFLLSAIKDLFKTSYDNSYLDYQKTEIASSATPSPAGNAKRNLYIITALAADAEFAAPSGTAVDGNVLMIRVKDNATPRALTYNAIYRAMQNSLPTTTAASKLLRMLFEYNAADTKWDLIGVDEET